MQNQMHARGKAVSRTWPALMRLHAVVSDAWYCDSSTTYTTLKTVRLPTSSGTTLRSAGLLLVKRPLGPVATMLGADERSTARLQAEQPSAEHASVDGRWGKDQAVCWQRGSKRAAAATQAHAPSSPWLLLLLLRKA